ncbi:indole-3-glycerol phosphate synthase TrpC [Bhargavaea beijingensis]|uniref:Indole-3-glycerol phosphate synthase n=1 Tax=Bhargavaea beijingensis TaxID=426756 RepID=A0ABX9ZE64_9BACL|nr:indole-3-glycerol phosphate synthase TrpC [Bhargavaea beijingensis]MCW1928983.1 indole-3-glycerol phosphate synthase TrpC [Bhargavaea beijingensis]RSK34370.1 indole-3-glycerol phosphate synthase TrpC [Bhargavaea beijingensis]
MTILDDILEEKRKRLSSLRAEIPATPAIRRPRPRLADAFASQDGLAVIAEVKRASPSKGTINADADPAEQALRYEQAGASCISVLTEEAYFKGSYDDLAAVAEAVRIPILCKDFIIDELQIDRALQAGASVILLIVAALPRERLRELHGYALSAGLDVLVEVHDEEELDRALQLEPEFIGINNRDLKTFNVDLGNTARLAAHAGTKPGRYLVSESGIMSAEDAACVRENGADAILVGESLMRSGDPGAAIRSYRGAEGVLRP